MTVVIDPITALQAEGLDDPTPQDVDRLERAALPLATRLGARFTANPDRTATCTRCERGTVTDLNGARWRCHACAGTGRVITPRPRAP